MPEWNMDRDALARGIKLFNSGEFFEAHEVLEDVWRESSGPDKAFLQGLIQLAVSLHHHSRGNRAGARSLLDRAARKLSNCPEAFADIDLPPLLASVEAWKTALAGDTVVPEAPKIRHLPSGVSHQPLGTAVSHQPSAVRKTEPRE